MSVRRSASTRGSRGWRAGPNDMKAIDLRQCLLSQRGRIEPRVVAYHSFKSAPNQDRTAAQNTRLLPEFLRSWSSCSHLASNNCLSTFSIFRRTSPYVILPCRVNSALQLLVDTM